MGEAGARERSRLCGPARVPSVCLCRSVRSARLAPAVCPLCCWPLCPLCVVCVCAPLKFSESQWSRRSTRRRAGSISCSSRSRRRAAPPIAERRGGPTNPARPLVRTAAGAHHAPPQGRRRRGQPRGGRDCKVRRAFRRRARAACGGAGGGGGAAKGCPVMCRGASRKDHPRSRLPVCRSPAKETKRVESLASRSQAARPPVGAAHIWRPMSDIRPEREARRTPDPAEVPPRAARKRKSKI